MGTLIARKHIFWGLASAFLISGCAAPALFKPAEKGDLAALNALLASGADPNAHRRAYGNRTALHEAANKSQAAAAKLLLEHGADPNAVAACGSTPLHFAACAGNPELVQLLLEAGANPAPPGAAGRCGYISFDSTAIGTPLQLAEQNGNTMAADLIKAAIANKLGLTRGGEETAREYGPLAGALLKNYRGGGKTIAVAGFSYADGRASADGDVVAARMTTALIKQNRLSVLERKEIQKVLGELKLQNAGAIDPDSAKRLGKMLGADLLVVGTMAELQGGLLELNIRLADVETGTAVMAVTGQVRKNWI